jgi:hypothetical protein
MAFICSDTATIAKKNYIESIFVLKYSIIIKPTSFRDGIGSFLDKKSFWTIFIISVWTSARRELVMATPADLPDSCLTRSP